ncbi:MAG: hypothetical protein NTW52_06460 [Planctomycetota bacterium]|nr:hypothetical protein [Planctomycetota bacterium]
MIDPSKNDFLLRAAQIIDQTLSTTKPQERPTTFSQAADNQSKLGNKDRAVDFSR